MKSLKSTICYPDYTKDSIKGSYQSESGRKMVFCIVEAEDDIDVYGKFITDQVVIQPSNIAGRKSWHNVESIVSDLHNEFPGITLFGIRDSDYTRYTKYVCPPNIFLTDARDLEMMMLHSRSVSSTLPEFKFADKITEAQETTRFLGYLRIYNEVKQAKCIFRKNVANSKLMWDSKSRCVLPDYKDRQFNAFKSYCDSNPNCTISVTRIDFDEFLMQLQLPLEVCQYVCRGHDTIKILSFMLQGTPYGDRKTLQWHLAQSYSYSDFVKTELYRSITDWASAKGFSVFINL